MTAAIAWHEAACNTLAFVALLTLAYVLPQSLKEGIGARLATRIFATVYLLIAALSRINMAADQPFSWWHNIVIYVQPFMVVGFLCCLALDLPRMVRRDKEALEEVYDEFGLETGDRVAAILRAVKR